MTRLPRWMHRAYARTFGYFWLPCPLCGREFGGHEWDGRIGYYEYLQDGVRRGHGCCFRHYNLRDLTEWPTGDSGD